MPNPISVLLADDDALVLRSLAAFLEDEGFSVFSTPSATEALKILQTEPIDVALVDVRLREMCGKVLILRGRELRPSTKYLMYTGSLGYLLPPELAAIGMTEADIIFKPVLTLSVITDAIRRAASPS